MYYYYYYYYYYSTTVLEYYYCSSRLYYPLIGLWRLETPNPKIPIYYAPELFVVNFSVDKPIHQSIGNFTAHLLLYGFVD